MSDSLRNVSFKGGGEIFIRPLVTGDGHKPFVSFGNADDFTFAISEDKKTQVDYTSEGGGAAAISSAISAVTGTINGLSYQADSLAIGLRGFVKTTLATGSTIETHTLSESGFIMLTSIVNVVSSISVKNTANATETALTEGTDFVIEGNAIDIQDSAFAGYTVDANDPLQIKVTLSTHREHTINAMSRTGLSYELFFNGFNEADSDNAVTVRCHKIQFSPTQALALINDDYGSNGVTFEVLTKDDETIISDSSYFEMRMRQDAGSDDADLDQSEG